MSEIIIGNYNEMVRYEPYIDRLRGLALFIARPTTNSCQRQYAFDLISQYTKMFACDIAEQNGIASSTLGTFDRSIESIYTQLGLTDDDIRQAKEKQRDNRSGFWEMRRVLGQFGDTAKQALDDGVSHIVTAAMSGCIIGEYIGQLMSRHFKRKIPVNHMVFVRQGKEPVEGLLRPNFRFNGSHALLVDDAVMETVTSSVMMKTLTNMQPHLKISLTAVEFHSSIGPEFYRQFAHVYPYIE